MNIENLTNPGFPPVNGDWVRMTFSNGAVVEQAYQGEDTTTRVPQPIPTLPRAQFLDLLMDAMGEDAFFALWDSTAFRRYRLKIELATVIDWSDAEPVADSLASQGLITSNKLEAFKAAWPKA